MVEQDLIAPWHLPNPTEEEAKRLMAGPFGKQIHELVVLHMTFLVFGTHGERGEVRKRRNGTCFFMKTPQRLFGVTAKHVVETLWKAKDDHPETICQIGNILLDPAERMIAKGVKADIATFDITESELNRIGKRPITLWPPQPPDVDNSGVVFAGFPAAAIQVNDPRTLGFGIYAATGIVQRVTDWQLSCTVDWEHSAPPPSGMGELPPKQFDTGGMSGGPMLSVRTKGGLVTFPLAGVVAEGRMETDTIIAERADCIRADGTIRV